MYKFCKTEQSFQRQRELEQGLLAMMEHHRFEEISVSDLCDRLNIPRKSFYRYFSSKDGKSLVEETRVVTHSSSIPMEKLITHRYPLSQINEAHVTNLKMEGLKIAIINE